MSFSMAGGGARGPQINVTPLIDVLLTLIIVFMIVVATAHPEVEGLRFLLGTKDAHVLYAKFGFAAPAHPERLMEAGPNRATPST